eukprot:CAMPEP_0185732116 /NCGR_PEP_ID=MMETSP1171-20130828/15067_1 /TAXON_ID=374046 /ORGANISM="Helicotheca tamensis, Strain CCMP826" /LENGTH=379 /DNA_ID=CAMNT_0028401527 /DNA_START=295 /DNA_END=1430 /DNA_ORIENTATION=+
MAQNPLLGSRISLISKKNIRYEGLLYSINEADATVALENVRSYGTEGREKLDQSGKSTYVPPQDAVHAYLLFRGCDIKDLHVHESPPVPAAASAPPPDPAIVSSSAPPDVVAAAKKKENERPNEQQGTTQERPSSNQRDSSADQSKAQPPSEEGTTDDPSLTNGKNDATSTKPNDTVSKKESPQQQRKADEIPSKGGDAPPPSTRRTSVEKKSPAQQPHNQQPKTGARNYKRGGGGRNRQKKNDPSHQVGTGASLLNRKARGAVEGGVGPAPTPSDDFDFESNLAEFDKANISNGNSDEASESDGGSGGNDADIETGVHISNAYSKDDFFDSISCDAIDKRDGVDNRLRGAAERSLNLDTFGAVSLGTSRRGGRRNRRG